MENLSLPVAKFTDPLQDVLCLIDGKAHFAFVSEFRRP